MIGCCVVIRNFPGSGFLIFTHATEMVRVCSGNAIGGIFYRFENLKKKLKPLKD